MGSSDRDKEKVVQFWSRPLGPIAKDPTQNKATYHAEVGCQRNEGELSSQEVGIVNNTEGGTVLASGYK